MSALDFYTHVAIRGDLLGAGIRSEPAEWEAKLGTDYLDVSSPGFIRRDYGLVEVSFQEEKGAWPCFGISVQVHRLRLEGVSAVPKPLRVAYGAFPARTKFAELCAVLTGQGFSVEPDNDSSTTDIHRYRVVQSGARIFVVAEAGAPDSSREGDVWSLSVSPDWWKHVR
ncbi:MULTISPECIES: hypothetical protein [unclassified Streptomyces]|uniref:hypothetical protein n=1 Tax=unclassified Streptomyces TaxID=2593676 RepID=UPI001F0340DD|nr:MULTISPECIES: hypothetical protein [unclassified Streptomyces]MCH0566505.1 hypothetical protein [Streptomyces sp. MUM 2J]MCH0571923.1 hypothetical protein [Streptomyces sp. MUM 136J]